jgi:uncharacterized membrane protein
VDVLSAVFRWVHILAGIIWIGMLYFFNFVNGPFAGTMDGDTKKKVVPELMPRALWWFRWGAAWTWVTGVLLLLLVFYHGGIMFEPEHGWSGGAIVMVALVFLAPFIYDALHKSPLGKDPKVFGGVCFVLVAIVICLMHYLGFSYRAYNIHLAGLFGTIMAFNVWYRIWPAQQKIITAVKEGTSIRSSSLNIHPGFILALLQKILSLTTHRLASRTDFTSPCKVLFATSTNSQPMVIGQLNRAIRRLTNAATL